MRLLYSEARVDMTGELLEAAKLAVQRSPGPMTVSQIGAAVQRQTKVKGKDRLPAEIRASLPGIAGIYVWPKFRNSPLFCSRPLALCVEQALLRALDEEPLSVIKAGSAVKKALRYVSEKHILKEIRVLLPRQTASGAIVRLATGRQSAIYLSRNWMARQARADGGESALASIIPAAIARLQSGPGNYVRVDHLRLAPEIRAVLDKEVIRLADAGKLVLGRYDGPLPVPADYEWTYIEDERGDLFAGVALPRDSEAHL
jgi:hypothetical protein